MLSSHKNLPVLHFKIKSEWIAWLDKNFDAFPKGVWVVIAKKGSLLKSISYEDIREGCLMYGWIDSIPNKINDDFYLQKVTPRRPKSIWSKINRTLVEEFIAQKKMKPSGMKEVDAAKKDGRWDAAYDSPKNMEVPKDFIAELQKDASAYEFYKTLTRANTYAIAFRLHTAKKPETREKRFKELLEKMKKKENV